MWGIICNCDIRFPKKLGVKWEMFEELLGVLMFENVSVHHRQLHLAALRPPHLALVSDTDH